jgi:hypothetical protein
MIGKDSALRGVRQHRRLPNAPKRNTLLAIVRSARRPEHAGVDNHGFAVERGRLGYEKIACELLG